MTTPRLGAPELVSGQAVPETTVNEQIRYLESGAGHFIFKDRDLATPPGSPADGDCYLIASSPTGAWSGKAGKITFYLNTAWVFITAIEGLTAWINDENVFVGYDGAAWTTLSSPSGSYLSLTGGTLSGDLIVPDEAYDATAWNGNLEVPTKNAVRDKIESLSTAYTDENARDAIAAMLAAGTHQSITVTNNDGADSMSLAVVPSIQSVTSSATVTPTFADDQVNITAQAAGLTLANPTGTAVPAWGLVIRIKDNGTARSIAYGTQYRAIGVTLPTTTVISKTIYLGLIYNSTDTKWDVVAVAQEA